ncbi:MAG: hypothetical protein GXO83_04475 [Chlorobi bacterium]|nr:hypothetical protein [Chlorobiota bacterium]
MKIRYHILPLILILILTLPSKAQTRKLDSLQSILDTTTSDERKASLFNEMSKTILPSDYTRGLSYAYLSLEFALRSKNQADIGHAYMRIANTYSFVDVQDIALDYYKQGLPYLEKAGDSLSLVLTHTFIGQTYFGIQQYDSALIHYRMARKLIKPLLPNLWYGFLDMFEGELFSKTGQPDSAQKYLEHALDFYTRSGNKNMIMESCLQLADFYSAQNKESKAYAYLIQAESTGKKIPSSHFYCRVEQKLAEYFISTGNNHAALIHLQRADTSLLLKPVAVLREKQYQLYANYYSIKKDYRPAFYARKRYLRIKDSLYQERLNHIQELMEIRYQTESKTGEIELLQKDYNIQLLKSRKNETYRRIGIAAIVVLSITLLLIIFFLIFKQRSANRLKLKKEELQKINDQLKVKEKARLHEKQIRDKLFSIIAHDLINPFNILLGFTALLYEEIQEYSREEVKRYAGLIHDSAKRLQFLLENLLQWSRLQTGRITFHPGYFEIKNVINRIITAFQIMTDKKKIRIEFHLPDETIVFGDESLIEVVLRNLIHNAIKYSKPDSQINIVGRNSENQLFLEVKDMGIGIEPQDAKKLFNLEHHFTKKGTAGEDGTGLGLILVKEILKMHNRELRYYTKPGEGSTFIFSLPLTRDKFSNHDNQKA